MEMDITFNKIKENHIAYVDETGCFVDETGEKKEVINCEATMDGIITEQPEIKYMTKTEPVDIVYQEPNQYEKDMLKGTLNPEELMKLEEEEKQIKEMSEEEKLEKKKRDIITMVKTISLAKLGKNPLSNPSNFEPWEKASVKDKMAEILKLEEDEIIKQFNIVCMERIFSSNEFVKYG